MNTTAGAKIVLIDTLDKLNTAAAAVQNHEVLGLDVETAQRWTVAEEAEGKAGIDFNRLSLRSIQFGDKETVYVLDCALVPEWQASSIFIEVLTSSSILKLAHNKNFEYKVLKKAGVSVDHMGCTMQAERILFLGLLNKAPSLAELVEKYCGIEMAKDVRDSFITEQEVLPLREEQVLYAANDVDVLLAIFEQQKPEIISRQLWKVTEFEWSVQRAFADIELRGVLVDLDRWTEIYQTTLEEHTHVKAELYQQFRADAVVRWEQKLEEREQARIRIMAAIDEAHDTVTKAKLQGQLDTLPSWYKIKPNKEGVREPKKTAMWHFDKVLTSPTQMKEVFAHNGIVVDDTNERTLQREKYFTWQGNEHLSTYPAKGVAMIDRLLKFRELDKRLSTYGPAWLRHMSPVTKRIHCEYDTLKETARTGCQRPNIQNVPKRGSGTIYRTAFVPAPGNVFVVADYSQIELRVAADFSGDEQMIAAFNSGVDFHTATAAKMFHISIEELAAGVKDKIKKYVDMRRAAKSVNFGIIFGIGKFKLSEQITFDSETMCTPNEAAKYLQLYSTSYPELIAYLKKLERDGQRDLVSFTHLGHCRQFTQPFQPSYPGKNASKAVLDQFKEMSDKYKMRMGGIGRESKNTPIQGSAACIAKQAILRLEEILPKYNAGIVAFIHDEIVVECPAEEAEAVLGIVKRTMMNAGSRFLKHLKAEVDAHIAMNWLADEDVDLDTLSSYAEEYGVE